MQELRVIGLDDDGEHVVCEGSGGRNPDRFRLRVDDTLKAAIAGELTKGVQTELEIGAELSPRDIQARIRAGSSVDEVANFVGAPRHRIERFANPVLLERARAAELAQLAHPVRGDGPMHTALADVIASALLERGHTDNSEWDAWKGPNNRWVVRIAWTVGKSQNEAHFKFAPGAHGGTATPVDDAAREMLDPDARRALRSIEHSGQYRPNPVSEHLRAVGDSAVSDDTPTAPAAVAPRTAPEAPRDHSNRHPEMPSWEDVLLGVRGGSNG